MNRHYSTFIVRRRDVSCCCCDLALPLRRRYLTRAQTEQDFAQIAGAGLNWVRIPIPFYMYVQPLVRAR